MNRKLQTKLIKLSFDLIHIPNATNKHFSYLLDGNKIVSVGFNNSKKTNPLAAKHNYYNGNIHSELDVIKRYKGSVNDLRYMTMVNVRVNRLGKVQNSRPCQECEIFLQTFDIKKIFYTNSYGLFEDYRWKN